MDQADNNNWGTPNLLTGARIAAVPVVMLLLCFPGQWASLFGGLAFVLAGATDFLSKPVDPSETISETPFPLEAMTGSPVAIASAAASPQVCSAG